MFVGLVFVVVVCGLVWVCLCIHMCECVCLYVCARVLACTYRIKPRVRACGCVCVVLSVGDVRVCVCVCVCVSVCDVRVCGCVCVVCCVLSVGDVRVCGCVCVWSSTGKRLSGSCTLAEINWLWSVFYFGICFFIVVVSFLFFDCCLLSGCAQEP